MRASSALKAGIPLRSRLWDTSPCYGGADGDADGGGGTMEPRSSTVAQMGAVRRGTEAHGGADGSHTASRSQRHAKVSVTPERVYQ